MRLLFGVVLLDLIGFGIVIPILPFLSPQLGADKLDPWFCSRPGPQRLRRERT